MVILILARHPRDAVRMRREAELYLHPPEGEVITIVFYEGPLRSRADSSSAENVFSWPRLCHGNVSDAAHVWKSRELVSHLGSLYGRISQVMVGDSHQETTIVAKMARDAFGAEIVLSPEGLGVFRARYGGYRWITPGYSAGLAKSASEVFTRCRRLLCAREEDRIASWHSLRWAVRHFAILAAHKPNWSVEPLELDHVNLIVSPWGPAVNYAISADRRIVTTLDEGASTRRDSPDSGLAYFVCQPIPFSEPEWAQVLSPLKELSIDRLVVRTRGGEPESALLAALRATMPRAKISQSYEGPAESAILSARPELLIGISSTVLFNIAHVDKKITVISLARIAREVSGALGARVHTYTDHQLSALKEFGSENLVVI